MNHKPATPLPIYALRLSWVQPQAGEVNVSEDRVRQLDAHVLHAANAYPRLVEEFRAFIEAAVAAKVDGVPARNGDIEAARALLRELGEE